MGKEPTTGKLSAKERRRNYKAKFKTTKKPHPPSAPASAVAGGGLAGKEERRHAKKAKKSQNGNGNGGAGQGKEKQQPKQQPSSSSSSALLASYPFETDYGDCFETPLQASVEAFQDLEPLLRALACLLHPTTTTTTTTTTHQAAASKAQLTIYDPFYCQGRVVRLLASLGFEASRVLNRLRDFYKDAAEGSVPAHDVLATNPPFSGDHKERILAHCLASDKPWCLLLPNYVANKHYYTAAIAPLVAQGNAPFYIVPSTKYEFDHPEGTGHATSPFFSIWFCHIPDPETRRAVLPGLLEEQAGGKGRWRVVVSAEGLRAEGAAPAWKRPSNKKRKKMKKQMMMQSQQGQQGQQVAAGRGKGRWGPGGLDGGKGRGL